MIIRSPRARQNFTIIENAIFDSGMSLEAIGLLCYLWGLPKKTELGPHLARKFCGRDRAYRIFKELIDAGYLSRQKTSGGWVDYSLKNSRRK